MIPEARIHVLVICLASAVSCIVCFSLGMVTWGDSTVLTLTKPFSDWTSLSNLFLTPSASDPLETNITNLDLWSLSAFYADPSPLLISSVNMTAVTLLAAKSNATRVAMNITIPELVSLAMKSFNASTTTGVTMTDLLFLSLKYSSDYLTGRMTLSDMTNALIKGYNASTMPGLTLADLNGLVAYANKMVILQQLTNASLLLKLLNVSLCTRPSPWSDLTPANQTSGCECIANTYLAFASASAASNRTTLGNASTFPAIKTQYSKEIYKCMGTRPVWILEECGPVCRSHPIMVVFYCHAVTFLITVSYVLFTWAADDLKVNANSFEMAEYIFLMCTLPVYAGLLIVQPAANILLIFGVTLVAWTIYFTLHDDFATLRPDYVNQPAGKAMPFVLATCICANFHLLLPAYTVIVSVTNLQRDYFGVFATAIPGLVIAYALQRLFYLNWVHQGNVKNSYVSAYVAIASIALLTFGVTEGTYLDSSGIAGEPITNFAIVLFLYICMIAVELEPTYMGSPTRGLMWIWAIFFVNVALTISVSVSLFA